jgi:hypothetical protein
MLVHKNTLKFKLGRLLPSLFCIMQARVGTNTTDYYMMAYMPGPRLKFLLSWF